MQGTQHPIMNRRVWDWTSAHGDRHRALWSPATGTFLVWQEITPGRWKADPYPPPQVFTAPEADQAIGQWIDQQ